MKNLEIGGVYKHYKGTKVKVLFEAIHSENKEHLVYEFETLEHELRHIILDEQEHIAELSLLLGE